jgi:hypothetical protein
MAGSGTAQLGQGSQKRNEDKIVGQDREDRSAFLGTRKDRMTRTGQLRQDNKGWTVGTVAGFFEFSSSA